MFYILNILKSSNVCFQTCTSGIYALKIYAKPRGADGTFPNVYNYVIKVTSPMENCEEFPDVSTTWSGGVDNEILEPRNGTLPAKQTVEFAVKVPEGKNLFILCAVLLGFGYKTNANMNEAHHCGLLKT